MSDNQIWDRFLSYLFTGEHEDTPVPPDYTFSFDLEPQRRAVYVWGGRVYPAIPRPANPWKNQVDELTIDPTVIPVDNVLLPNTSALALALEDSQPGLEKYELGRMRDEEKRAFAGEYQVFVRGKIIWLNPNRKTSVLPLSENEWLAMSREQRRVHYASRQQEIDQYDE